MNPDEQPVSHESRASLIHVGTLMKLTDFPQPSSEFFILVEHPCELVTVV